MSLTFGVDTVCSRCHGSTRNRAGVTCSWCQGTGWEPGQRAVARNTDPETSKAAAQSVGSIRHSQALILELLREVGPLTDEAIYRHHRITRAMSSSGARTRRHELEARGLVVDTGKRETLPSGRSAIVWAAR